MPTELLRSRFSLLRYQRDPPKVTTLYGLRMPTSKRNTVRYDDGSGDTLDVPLGGTACKEVFASLGIRPTFWTVFRTLVSESQSAVTSGKVAFDLLSDKLKSLAVRLRVKYMPHPYVAIGTAKSRPTGLGMESVSCPFVPAPPPDLLLTNLLAGRPRDCFRGFATVGRKACQDLSGMLEEPRNREFASSSAPEWRARVGTPRLAAPLSARRC